MAKRTDATQQAIVEALRRIGVSVLDLHTVGHGCPDLLVTGRDETFLMEVKSPGGRLTPLQESFKAQWQGKVVVVQSVEEALSAVWQGDYE